jgi:hypothetical protein
MYMFPHFFLRIYPAAEILFVDDLGHPPIVCENVLTGRQTIFWAKTKERGDSTLHFWFVCIFEHVENNRQLATLKKRNLPWFTDKPFGHIEMRLERAQN